MNSFLDSLPVQQDANTRISVDRSPIEPNFPTIGNGTNVIYNHTYYNCTSPLDNINFRDAKIVGSLLPLGVVCLMVILGNIMVITAIRITKKLRGATNMFIGEKTWNFVCLFVTEKILCIIHRELTMAHYCTHLCQRRTIRHSTTAGIRSRELCQAPCYWCY